MTEQERIEQKSYYDERGRGVADRAAEQERQSEQPRRWWEEAERIARAFHETYERLAPAHGYKTRDESAVPWEKVPLKNRDLMVGTVQELINEGMLPAESLRQQEASRTEALREMRDRAFEFAGGSLNAQWVHDRADAALSETAEPERRYPNLTSAIADGRVEPGKNVPDPNDRRPLSDTQETSARAGGDARPEPPSPPTSTPNGEREGSDSASDTQGGAACIKHSGPGDPECPECYPDTQEGERRKPPPFEDTADYDPMG